MALEQFKTQVLLLHSEQSTLDALSTGFGDQYAVHCATSGVEALTTLGETPIDVIVSAHELPGMSGYEALKEARKRSPDTIGILLAGKDRSDGLEALVSEQDVFRIVRGETTPDALVRLIEETRQRVRLLALSESANDTAANVDEPGDDDEGEHIIMETADNGSVIISDGTGRMPALKPDKIQVSPNSRGSNVDVLVLSRDEEFLATIKDSARGLHNVYHATTPEQAEEYAASHRCGVLVTDAAMIGSDIEGLNQRLWRRAPRLVAIVAGRRDDGDMLMDLINRGQVYRFLLKPVSPGRARLAIEASVKHHLDAPDATFKMRQMAAGQPPPAARPAAAPAPKAPPAPTAEKPAASPGPAPTDDGPGVRKGLMAAARGALSRRPAAKPAARPAAPDSAPARARPAVAPPQTPRPAEAAKPAPASAPPARRAAAPATKPAAEPPARREPHIGNPARQTPAQARRATPPPTAPKKPASGDKPAAPPGRQAGKPSPAAKPAARPGPPPSSPALDSLDDAFGDAGSLSETVSGLATTVRSSISARRDAGTAAADSGSGRGMALLRNPRILAAAGVAVAVVGAGLWWLTGSDEAGVVPAGEPAAVAEPAVTAPAPAAAAAAQEPAPMTAPLFQDLLDRARDARDAGDLYAPAGDNAMEYYVAARDAAPGNAEVAAELAALSEEIFGLAEAALLDNRYTDASRALRVIGLADPDNPRLAFLNTQLRAQRLNELYEDARAAIREGRYQDAGERLTQAEAIASGRTAELDALTEELAAARSAGRLGDVLDLAGRAAAEDRLISPANDNARYYYELALTIDPDSTLAAQGLDAVASKLALRARGAVDAGELDRAERLLEQARQIAPASQDIAAADNALRAARTPASANAPSGVSETAAAAAEAKAGIAEPTPTGGADAAPAESAAAATQSPANSEPSPASGPSTAAGPGDAVDAGEAAADTDGSATGTAPPPPAAESTAGPEDPVATAAGPEQAETPAAGVEPASAPATEPGATDPGATEPGVEKPAAPAVVSISALKRTRYVPPQYPRSAQRRDVTGWVDVTFTVGTDGRVVDVSVSDSDPSDVFDDAAIDAVRQWRFEPVLENGVPREKRVVVRMAFELQ